jgi:small subunit ribosomal protein S21
VVQINVRDNNVDQALKILKRKLQKEGLFKEIKQRRFYEKPSEKRVRKAQEAVRRSKKMRKMNNA